MTPIGESTIVRLDLGKVIRILGWAVGALTLAGLIVGFIDRQYGHNSLAMRALNDWFDVDGEATIIAWFSSMLFVLCSLLLFFEWARRRQQRLPHARGWLFLGLIFILLAIDESVVIHERLGTLLEPLDLHGFLSFSWVLPAAVAVVVGWFLIRPLLISSPPDFRRRAIWAAVTYVGGALGLESLSAAFFETMGLSSIPYLLAAGFEEGLEMAGLAMFLVALLRLVQTTANPAIVDVVG